MKQQLLSLYESRHDDFKSVRVTHPDEDMAGPFLMSPNDKYKNQQNRLLIVGQETFGWYYHLDDLAKQMTVYEDFNLGEEYYSSPFWNVIRKIERILGKEPYSSAWTNISKYDHNEWRPIGEFANTISKLDDILIQEIKIIQPKICLFFTGPSFDNRLENIYEGLQFAQVDTFDLRTLAKLVHPELPALTFRSYHPNYLRRSGIEGDFIKFVESLNSDRKSLLIQEKKY
jgi:hypothetical protein